MKRGTLEMLEETVHLVRVAPWQVLAAYAAGTLPFALGLLFFWADMSRSAFAAGRCAALSAVLALLFLWMKCWQTVYCQKLYQLLGAEGESPWSLGRFLRCLATQSFVQPTGFVVLPVAAILVLPAAWCYAFYNYLTCLGDGREEGLRSLVKDAWKQSLLWPRQHHNVLLVFSLFALVVFLNIVVAALLLPFALKGLFGLETAFTRSGWAMFNTTFLAACAVTTYLCVDPFLKAHYVLRLFYGFSIRTGTDLKLDLQRAAGKSRILLAACLLALAGEGLAAEDVGREGVPVQPLEQSIREVIAQPEYTWRMPRERPSEDEELGLFGSFLRGSAETVWSWLEKANEWIRKWIRKFVDWLPERTRSPGRPLGLWQTGNQWLLFLLLAVLLSALGVFLLRLRRSRASVNAVGEAVPSILDLESEDVGADELPTDGWLGLAEELMAKGDFRLALRALYLGTLSFLSEEQLIRIAKFKSNRDYRRELSRKAHSLPELCSAFSDNVRLFDLSWYGMREVTEGVMTEFQDNWERIRSLGTP